MKSLLVMLMLFFVPSSVYCSDYLPHRYAAIIEVERVDETTHKDRKCLGGALTGGLLGAAVADHNNKSIGRYSAIGAAGGCGIHYAFSGGDSTQTHYIYTIAFPDGNKSSFARAHNDLRVGQCLHMIGKLQVVASYFCQ